MQIFYTVRLGDTLTNISGRFNIPLASLANSNNLSFPYTIYVGQQLSMPPGVTTYVVKSGDSVSSISERYGIPISIILKANGIEPPYTLIPAQVLTIPQGVPYYIVRPRDAFYKIASKYNVIINGIPRPDLILKSNLGLTPNIIEGMSIAIPYPPPGGTGTLAVILDDQTDSYLGLYEPVTGKLNTIYVDRANEASRLFWSPDQNKIAYISGTGIISIFNIMSMSISKIDKTEVPGFIDWSPDSNKIVYSDINSIKIYDVSSYTLKTINRPRTTYVQWFPNGNELLYEARDKSGTSQLYKSLLNGSNELQITNNINGILSNVRLSPNGKFALYTTPGVSISEIYIVELATGSINKIPGGPEAKNYNPAWSPDSTKIAYSSAQFINGKYYSLIRFSGANGENDSTIAISSCYATPVTWSPDSRKIAYLSGCKAEYHPVEVWSIDITRQVPNNLLSGFTFYSLDWSPTR